MPSFPDFGRIIQELALIAVPFLLAITCHEVAHGYAALRLGDPTAKLAGRLTFNPLKHIDPVGLLVLVLTRMIGWAKPVPVDTRYFKDPRKGTLIVSLAGPMANFVLAAIFAVLVRLMLFLLSHAGSRVELMIYEPLARICVAGVFINVVLGVFNLMPIPPLDGSGVLAYFLPREAAARYLSVGRYGFIILLLLIMTGLFGRILGPIVDFIQSVLL